MNFGSDVKFCDILKELQGVDLKIDDMDLSVRVYNLLKRSDIHNLQQLLSMSIGDFMNILINKERRSRNLDKFIGQIVYKLQQLSITIKGDWT